MLRDIDDGSMVSDREVESSWLRGTHEAICCSSSDLRGSSGSSAELCVSPNRYDAVLQA
jgi:hypothetical protein